AATSPVGTSPRPRGNAPCASRSGRVSVVAVGTARRPRYHEADPGALVVDRAGLVVDQAEPLGDRNHLHLVEVALVSALAGDRPEIAGVLDPGPVPDERLLGIVERLDEHDRAVELAVAHQAAADRLLDAVAQARPDVADDLDPLALGDAELADGVAVAVFPFCH